MKTPYKPSKATFNQRLNLKFGYQWPFWLVVWLEVLLVTIALSIFVVTEVRADEVAGQVRFRSFANTGGQEVYIGVPDLGIPENRLAIHHTWSGSDIFAFGFNEYDIGGITAPRIFAELEYNNGVATQLFNQQAMQNANVLRIRIWNRDQGWLSMPVLQLRRGIELTSVGPFVPTETDELYQLQQAGWCPGQELDWALEGLINQVGPFSGSQELSKIEISIVEAGFWPDNECSDTLFRDGFES